MASTRPTMGSRQKSSPPRLHSERLALGRHAAGWISPPLGDVAWMGPRSGSSRRSETADLPGTVDHLARGLRGAWFVAVLRRSLVCGLLAGCLLALLVAWVNGALWIAPLGALVVAAGLAIWSFRAVPRSDAAARFLDHALGLKEQLATALELGAASGRANSFLGTELRRSATTTVRTIASTRSVRARPAFWEWTAIPALLLVMALIATAPFEGGSGVRMAAGPSAGTGAMTPVLPVGPANPRVLSVRVAVVSSPSANVPSSQRSSAGASTKPSAAAVRRAPVGQPGTQRRTGHTAGSSPRSGTNSVHGQVTNSHSSHTIPLVRGSESFVPTTPSTKGSKGGSFTATQPLSRTGHAGGAGSAGGAPAKSGGSGAASKGKGSPSSNQNGAGQNAAAPGKNAAGATNAGTCTLLYVCSRLTPSQITAPGLVTGKGGFSGKGAPGGQSAGHARAASPTLGHGKVPSPSAASKQLAISSAYGSNKAGSRSARQVTGHNGAGSANQTTVTAGADSGQTVDYVPPDANTVPPGEATIVSRYFTSHSSP
jgi:hypothetical protein